MSVEVVRIPKPDRLDPITLYLVDEGGGRGRMTIVCYNEAWTCYWGAMGSHTLREFVAHCDAQYVAGNMLSGRKHSAHDDAYAQRIAAAAIAALQPPTAQTAQGLPMRDPHYLAELRDMRAFSANDSQKPALDWAIEILQSQQAGAQGGEAIGYSPPAVPSDVLEARAQGRSEALAIILGLDAEEGLDEYVDSIPPGPAGEWGTAWNAAKLRELLRADDTAWSLLQEAEGEYWHNLGLREETERMPSRPAIAPQGGEAMRLVPEAWLLDVALGALGGDESLVTQFALAATQTATNALLPFTDATIDKLQDVMARHGFTVPVRVISDAFRTAMYVNTTAQGDSDA